jgi:hypothetical protein
MQQHHATCRFYVSWQVEAEVEAEVSWETVQGDADKWRVDHPYVSKQAIKQFGNKLYAG